MGDKIKSQKEGDHDEASSTEREIDPKDPYPRRCSYSIIVSAFSSSCDPSLLELGGMGDGEMDSPFCARPPPTIGPATVPNAQTLFSTPNHFPRSRSGMRSVIRISLSATTPPPPTPCSVRPTIKTVKFLATAATMEPTVKKTKAMMILRAYASATTKRKRGGALYKPRVYDRRYERARRNWAGRRWR